MPAWGQIKANLLDHLIDKRPHVGPAWQSLRVSLPLSSRRPFCVSVNNLDDQSLWLFTHSEALLSRMLSLLPLFYQENKSLSSRAGKDQSYRVFLNE